MPNTAPAPAPTVSVVVATGAKADALRQLLLDVEPSCRQRGAELIVVGVVAEELERLRTAFPAVLFAEAPKGADQAELRSLGTAAASGDIIIISDDTRPLPEEWLTINV
jgi:hypothetical protein